MPAYNILCPNCGLDKEEFTTYEIFCEHNDKTSCVLCPSCNKITAYYSLTHLKENLRMSETNVSNFYPPCTQEKWYRGFGDLGKR